MRMNIKMNKKQKAKGGTLRHDCILPNDGNHL